MKETKDVRCDNCKGIGRVIDEAWYESTCKACSGFGTVNTSIEIPDVIDLNAQFPNVNQNLEILAEECAEVIQIKSKIARFGLGDHHPKNKQSNKDSLEQELGDVLAMIDILKSNGVISQTNLDIAKQKKIDKLGKYYNYNRGQYVNG